MQQEDYLKRQIDQLARVLGKILSDLLGLKNQGQAGEVIEITSQALKSELDLDIQEIIDISTDDFVETLKSKRSISNGNLDQLAEILLLIADSKPAMDKNKLYMKCLTIYQYLENAEKTYSLDRQLKMERIKNQL